jgi:hypothetical protein
VGTSVYIEQLPSGSWRAKVYAGKDPLTGREIRFRKTRRTEVEAQIELGRLLELAWAGRLVVGLGLTDRAVCGGR